MKTNKTFPKLNNYNEIYTPDSALDYIAPCLPRELVYWEACYGEGHMAESLRNRGFTVVGDKNIDCLLREPENWDVFITNPPFNGNKKFLKRAIDLGKPFVILFRLEHLGGVDACKLLKDIPVTVIVPEKRINYLTSKTIRGEITSSSPFHSVFLVHGLPLPKGIFWVKKDTKSDLI